MLFNKLPDMSFLRAILLSSAFAATALAQTLPSGLVRSGDVVMMQPIPDGSGAGVSGVRPSRLRFLPAPDHDLFVRAFEAASKGDWTGARALAAQSQNGAARQLLEWR